MKKFINNQKSLIMGIIIGLLITSFSFASSDQIQAVFTNFNLTINGQNVPLQTKPIVYNGTSYLPVREISNILGYDVDFNSNTQTIILDNQGGIVKEEPPKETTPINNSGNTNNASEWLRLTNIVDNYSGASFSRGDADIELKNNNYTLIFDLDLINIMHVDGTVIKIRPINNPNIELQVRYQNYAPHFLKSELQAIGFIE